MKPYQTQRNQRRATLFQFHKGTIETISDIKLSLPVNNFNSIKVRLKHLRFALVAVEIDDFNSIKVRLKLSRSVVAYENKIFQFHKGTIETDDMEIKVKRRFLFQFHKGTIETARSQTRAAMVARISIP